MPSTRHSACWTQSGEFEWYHSRQQDNNEGALLNFHVETGTSEVPVDANNSSLAARNPNWPVLMSQAPLNAAQKAQANARRASQKISAAQCKETEDALTGAIQQLLAEQNASIEAITSKHGVTQDKLANALIHAKAQEVNADLPRGTKYSLDEIREMVKADESMQNLVHEEQQEYINKLTERCALQNMSIRATNTAAARDVQSTLDNVFKMLDGLALRTGIYTCLFASRGHVYDTAQAMWFGTDNVMDFWEDVLQTKADKIARKLEQWACMAGRNIDEHETVQNMQRVCTRLLNSGLRTIAKRRNIRINYTNFDTAMKEKLAINLKGWPEGVPFQSPTSINNLKALLKVRDALKDGSCHLVCMSPCQREEYAAQLTAHRKKGEVIGKLHKKRADAGVPRKCKGKENAPLRNQARASGSSTQAPKSVEYIDTSDEEDTSDDEV
ncbi:uncharacterized protein EDB93DRAFT_1258552 [Suillus bovinus]|uniref:uncharacterized protein n=1 Tax=Suillus bovinus TaxID=48563 RepID=UPI001B87815E|nr:uncharacterized protein EDB93DRAFT_1258552 [Suillus bovinus]KAG2124848.1 hypothetical protein EDB93DRAFT_1258552 [Suillus bovinus]